VVADPFRFAPLLVAGDVWPLLAAEMLVDGGRPLPLTPTWPLLLELARRLGHATWACDFGAQRVRRTHSQPFCRSVRRCSNSRRRIY
jgi:hypothetical protein